VNVETHGIKLSSAVNFLSTYNKIIKSKLMMIVRDNSLLEEGLHRKTDIYCVFLKPDESS
jgi:hypothetical protein